MTLEGASLSGVHDLTTDLRHKVIEMKFVGFRSLGFYNPVSADQNATGASPTVATFWLLFYPTRASRCRHLLIQYTSFSYQRTLTGLFLSPKVKLISATFSKLFSLLVSFSHLVPVGGFQRAATKAGSALYSCTKWKPGKMLTPTCFQRERPAASIRFSVSVEKIPVFGEQNTQTRTSYSVFLT